MDGRPDDDEALPEDIPPISIGMALLYVLLLAVGVLWCRHSDRVIVAHRLPLRFALEIAVAIAVGFVTVGVVGVVWKYGRVFRAIEGVLAERLGNLGMGGVLRLSALSALAEEVFFRGALQPFMIEWLGGTAAGYTVTSLVFGLLHIGSSKTFLPWTAFAAACGFILGGSFLLTGNLAVPIVIHFIINAVNMRLIVKRARNRSITASTVSSPSTG